MRPKLPSLVAALLSATRAAAVTELKIGFLYPQTDVSWHVESWSQFKLAIQDVNADPGLLPNYRLSYAAVDSGATAMDALKGASQLIADGVVGIVGLANEFFVLGPSVYSSAMQTPILSPYSTSTENSNKQKYPYLFRTTPSDATMLRGLAVLVKSLSWTRVGVLSDEQLAIRLADVLLPVLDKLDLFKTTFTYPPPSRPGASFKINQVFSKIFSSGRRVLILYANAADMSPIYAAAQAAGLFNGKFAWLMPESIFKGSWLGVSNVLLAKRVDDTTNPVSDAFATRWASTSTRYDPSVHGTFNLTTKSPFYGNGSEIWDMSSSGSVGDGVPEPLATVVYDTTRILALALHEITQAGDQPANGTALRAALLNTSHTGVSGSTSFHSADQDRLLRVPFALSRGPATPPYLVGRTTQRFDADDLSSATWCSSGCTDIGYSERAAIPWSGGARPGDGGSVDPTLTTVRFTGPNEDGNPSKAIISWKDSAGNPICTEDCADAQTTMTMRCYRCRYITSYESRSYSLSAVDDNGQPVRSRSELGFTGDTSMLIRETFLNFTADDRNLTLIVKKGSEVLASERFLFRSTACPSGQVGRDTNCAACPRGQVLLERGLANCTPCAIGTVQPMSGQSTCNDCAPGQITTSEGQSECLLCPLGRFQSQAGSSICQPCPVPMTTLAFGSSSVQACVCPQGMYRPATVTLSEGMTQAPCQPCPKGMQCPGASDERALLGSLSTVGTGAVAPQLLPSYWSQATAPMTVFQCTGGPLQCPGGMPETCGSNWGDLVCALCAEGYYRDGGVCTKCPSQEASRMLFPVLPILLALCVVFPYYKLAVDKGMRTWNLEVKSVGHLVGLTLAYIQLGGLILGCNLNLPKEGSTAEVQENVNSPLGLLQLDCAGVRTYDAKLALGLALPAWVVAAFVIFLLISIPLRKVTAKANIDANVIFSCIGSMFLSFYITICAMSLDLFKCYDHPAPNTARSVSSAPQILCNSDKWKDMLAVAVVGAVFYCGFSMAVFVYALKVAPRHRKDEAFHKRWKFLLARFRPLERWWGILVLFKSLLLNVVQIVMLRGQDQLVAFQFLLALYGMLVVWRQPWRHYNVNLLDASVHLVQAFTCAFLYWYAEVPTGEVDFVRAMMVEKIMMPLPLCFLLAFVVAMKGWDHYQARRGRRFTVSGNYVESHRSILAQFAEFDLEEAADMMMLIAPLDRALFNSLCKALDQEESYATKVSSVLGKLSAREEQEEEAAEGEDAEESQPKGPSEGVAEDGRSNEKPQGPRSMDA